MRETGFTTLPAHCVIATSVSLPIAKRLVDRPHCALIMPRFLFILDEHRMNGAFIWRDGRGPNRSLILGRRFVCEHLANRISAQFCRSRDTPDRLAINQDELANAGPLDWICVHSAGPSCRLQSCDCQVTSSQTEPSLSNPPYPIAISCDG